VDNSDVSHLAAQARRLKGLSETDGWQELQQVFTDRKNKWAVALANDLLRKDSTINQREVDWRAGFVAGCEWILSNPDAVAGNLERALKRADRNE
jgi:hypothetical protein